MRHGRSARCLSEFGRCGGLRHRRKGVELSSTLRDQSRELAVGAGWAAAGTALEGASLLAILLISLFQ